MLMDYMKEIKEISAEQAIILWQASRLSLSKIYEKAPEILKVQGSVIGTLGNFSASIGKAKSKKTFNVSAIVAAALKNGTVLRYVAELPEEKKEDSLCGHGTKPLSLSESHETYFTACWSS